MSPLESDRIMYEIYREEGYDRRFRVVYFTELGDHDKEREINRALAGEHVYDGFISEGRKEAAKGLIAAHLDRWNEGEDPDTRGLASEIDKLENAAGRPER